MIPIKDGYLIKDAVSAETSATVKNVKADSITFQVSGTASALSITINAKTDANANFVPVALLNLADCSVIKNGAVTAKGRYSLAGDGVREMQVVVNSVSGGDVTVYFICNNTEA